MTDYDMWKYLYGKAVDQGLAFDPRSGLKSTKRTCDLIRAVRTILMESGHSYSDEQIQAILEMRIPNLVSSWTGVDTEAHRAIDKYFRVHPEGLEEHREGQDQGHGQNQDQQDQDQFRNGGQDGDGDDGGNDDDHEKDDEEQKQRQGKGDGQIDPIPDPVEPDPTPVPTPEPDPTPQPQDPDYIKPKIWNQFMRILMWNMEHPGKQKNIMLVGPRGIGKTEMVIQAAKALNSVYPEMCAIPYMITSPQMKHEVTGYGNATGEYVPTEFTKGYVAAGITLIEEMDRSEPTALIAMNAALANKIMDTPVQGMIVQNDLCNVVATANTAGIGATEMYNTASQLDASTRDRFVYLEMDFDEELAVQIARGDKHLVEFVKRWNTACEYEGLMQNTCSYRALVDIKDLRDGMGFTIREALENVVLKAAVPKDNLKSILDKMQDISMNPYFSAMGLIQASMPDVQMC